MFGKLARWLRLLGHDAAWANEYDTEEGAAPDGLLLQAAIAEGRYLVTRDKQFGERAEARGLDYCFIPADDIETILQGIVNCTGLAFEFDPDSARCPKCNTPVTRVVNKKFIEERVPPGSFAQYDEYWQCQNPDCKQVYWEGTHIEEIRAVLAKLG